MLNTNEKNLEESYSIKKNRKIEKKILSPRATPSIPPYLALGMEIQKSPGWPVIGPPKDYTCQIWSFYHYPFGL